MALQELFANNSITTLGSALSSSATTLTVAVGTGALFPAITSGSQFFTCTLIAAGSATETPNEIVQVTARTGDTFTIVRGYEGTTPQTWHVGDTVGGFPTAGWANSVAKGTDVQLQPGNYALDTGTANTGSITLNPAPASLAALAGIHIRILKTTSASNTGAYTLNVNGLGAVPVQVQGEPLENNMLSGGAVFEVMYNTAHSTFELLSFPRFVYNDYLAGMALQTVKANLTGGTASPQDVTISALASVLSPFFPSPPASGIINISGSPGNNAFTTTGPAGSITETFHDFVISTGGTFFIPYGAGWTYGSWARAWVNGDDHNGDVSVFVLTPALNGATIASNVSGFSNCTLFSKGQ